jgi:hypothetical protein
MAGMLDSGWAAAIAAIVTALIVAGTAVAAFRQLRHGRNANDIVVYLRLIEFMDSPVTVAARQNMRRLSEKVATDAVYRENLGDRTFNPEEFQSTGETLRFLEHISVLVTQGGVAERLVLAEYAESSSRCGSCCARRSSAAASRSARTPAAPSSTWRCAPRLTSTAGGWSATCAHSNYRRPRARRPPGDIRLPVEMSAEQREKEPSGDPWSNQRVL